ncbi:MAG: hypothetical protein KJ000_30745 [Pirellulaceae bacterium]|nr:hypothetical protein [Pirellulaceae bacterium]
MTLTELLVVIMIMAFLLGAALPVMRMAMEDRAMREASRQLNTYIQLAKSQAAEKGRPVGLWLETQSLPEGTPTDARYCQQLFVAETPPPYAGDMVGATIRVNSAVVGNDPITNRPRYQAQFVPITAVPPPVFDQIVSSANFANLVQVGDTIRFDFKGPAYRITDLTALPVITFEGETFQPRPPTGDMKYQVFRSPQKSGITPMEFTGGAVIDLSVSGVGLTGREFATATTPIIIMFSPTGSVDRILGQGMPVIPPSTIHLLIGSLSNMMEPGENSTAFSVDYNKNLETTANLWVSVSLHTGTVVTAPNAWEPRADFNSSLSAAREFAQQGQAMGGR